MLRRMLGLLAILSPFIASAVQGSVSAQDDGGSEATIAALKTEVAAHRTYVAEPTAPTSEPSTSPRPSATDAESGVFQRGEESNASPEGEPGRLAVIGMGQDR